MTARRGFGSTVFSGRTGKEEQRSTPATRTIYMMEDFLALSCNPNDYWPAQNQRYLVVWSTMTISYSKIKNKKLTLPMGYAAVRYG